MEAKMNPRNQLPQSSNSISNDEDLLDDIEDKNATFSGYSVAKDQSTRMTTESGNSSSSSNSKRKKKKKGSVMNQLFSRFANMLYQKKQVLQSRQPQGSANKQQEQQHNVDLNFKDQLKRIREQESKKHPNKTNIKDQKSKAIFKIDEDLTSNVGSNELMHNQAAEEDQEYMSSSDEDINHKEGTNSQPRGQKKHQQEEEQSAEEEEYYDEEEASSEESELEDIFHSIHRLPFKNQKVNLLYCTTMIEIQKQVQQLPAKKTMFSKLFSSKPEKNSQQNIRFIIFDEQRIVVVKPIQEEERKYGSLFSQQKSSFQMPRIRWNAQVRSVRRLEDLEQINILNYIEVFGDKKNGIAPQPHKLTKIQLKFYDQHATGPTGAASIGIKNYLIEKDNLEEFVLTLRTELKKARKSEVTCRIS